MPGSTPSSGVSGRLTARVAVVDEDDLVARQRELVAAAGADAVERGEERDAANAALASSIARRVSLVNLQKFTLAPCDEPREHVDVRAGAEDALLERR